MKNSILTSIVALSLMLFAGISLFAQTKMVGGAEMYPTKNIVENAVNSKDHTTLVAAVKAHQNIVVGSVVESGSTMTGDLNLGDNIDINFGTGTDLKIYHDGSHSYITDGGTGNLKITATQLDILGTSETMATFIDDGAVTLYHNDAAKIATTATGTSVTGNVIATGTVEPAGDTAAGDNAAIGYTAAEGLILTGQGSTSDITIKNDADADVFTVATGTTTGTFAGTVLAKTDTDATNTGSVTLDFTANQNFVLTLTGNVTLANPTTEQVGQSGFIAFIQDGTGSRTVSLGTDYETAAAAGLTLTSTASATDLVPYLVVASGRILLGTPQLAFA